MHPWLFLGRVPETYIPANKEDSRRRLDSGFRCKDIGNTLERLMTLRKRGRTKQSSYVWNLKTSGE